MPWMWLFHRWYFYGYLENKWVIVGEMFAKVDLQHFCSSLQENWFSCHDGEPEPANCHRTSHKCWYSAMYLNIKGSLLPNMLPDLFPGDVTMVSGNTMYGSPIDPGWCFNCLIQSVVTQRRDFWTIRWEGLIIVRRQTISNNLIHRQQGTQDLSCLTLPRNDHGPEESRRNTCSKPNVTFLDRGRE